MTNLGETHLILDAEVISEPKKLADYNEAHIYSVIVRYKRLSGKYDEFDMNYILENQVELHKGDFVHIEGEIRTLNSGNSAFVLESFIFAKDIQVLDAEPDNYVNCVEIKNAFMYNFEELRKSFSDNSKDIATYKIRVTRKHSRNSYFKVTSWGSDARFLGRIHEDLEYFDIKCRLQSFVSKKNNKLHLSLVTFEVAVNK